MAARTRGGATRDLFTAGSSRLGGGRFRPSGAAPKRPGRPRGQRRQPGQHAGFLVAEVARNYVATARLQAAWISRGPTCPASRKPAAGDWRRQAGLGSSLEVNRARTKPGTDPRADPRAGNRLREAENRLASCSARRPPACTAAGAGGRDSPGADTLAAGIPADTCCRRPDVRAAERQLAAETARIGVARPRAIQFQPQRLDRLEALQMGDL